MALILNIETSTKACSVAISSYEKVLSSAFILRDKYSHAEKLNPLIEQIMADAKVKYTDLDAIAISDGPGSYTGLRIGASTAKGLCFALQIPLIALHTLKILAANSTLSVNSSDLLCPMIDARRMEVYCAFYDATLKELVATEAVVLDENTFESILLKQNVVFFGDGAAKSKAIFEHQKNATILEEIHPRAEDMARLSFSKFSNKQFEDVAYYEPNYLKQFVAGKAKKYF